MKINCVSNSSNLLEVTKDHIVGDLRKIGINKGDHLAVTLSFKSIGFVKGGPSAFIDALLETVGPDGTIMMNTFTLAFPLSEIRSDYIFDPKSTVSYTGLVPETLRKRKDSLRSQHPTNSVAAIGKLAKHLTEGHDENSSPFMPYSKLAQIGGKYLCIGIGNRLVGIRHEAQYRAGLFVVPFLIGTKYRNKKGEIKFFFGKGVPCIEKLPDMVPTLEKMGIIKRGKIGMASSILAYAGELIDAMAEMLKKNPTLNLCDNILCLQCRELERRMNLYERIENPKFFQKSILMRKIITLRNGFLLKRYNQTSFGNSKGKKVAKRTRFNLSKIFDTVVLTISRILNR